VRQQIERPGADGDLSERVRRSSYRRGGPRVTRRRTVDGFMAKREPDDDKYEENEENSETVAGGHDDGDEILLVQLASFRPFAVPCETTAPATDRTPKLNVTSDVCGSS